MRKFILSITLFLSLGTMTLFVAQTTSEFRSNPSGFGGSGDWNSIANWQQGNGGGWAAASRVPDASTDIVTIQENHSVTLDMSPSVENLIIEANGELRNTSGTLQGIYLYGDLTVNGQLGSSSDNIAVSIHSTGTQTFAGTGTIHLQYVTDLQVSSSTLVNNGNLKLYKTSNVIYSGVPAFTFEMGTGTLEIVNASSLGGSSTVFDFSGGTVTYSADGDQTIEDGIVVNAYNNLVLSGSGTKTLAGNTGVNGTLSLAGTASFDDGGFNLVYGNSSTLKYAGSVTQVTTANEFASVNNLDISNTAGVTLHSSATILGNLTISTGATLNDNGKTLTVEGNYTNNGVHAGSGKIILDPSSAPAVVTGASDFGNLEITDNTNLTGTINLEGSLTQTGGTLANAAALTFADGATITRSGGTFTNSGSISYDGTVNLNYTGAVTTGAEVSGAGSSGINNMTIGAAVTLGSNVTVNGTLALNDALTTTGYTVTIKNPLTGDLTNFGSNGSLTVAGTSGSILVPSTTYNTLTVNNPNGTTIVGDVTATNITCSLGNIYTTSGNSLTLAAGGTLTEAPAKYVVGNLVSSTQSDFTELGLTLSNAPITGTISTLTRVSGNGAAVQFGANEGINRTYTINGTSMSFAIDGSKTVMQAWVNDDKNGKNMNNVVAWAYDANNAKWLPLNVTDGIAASGSYNLTSTETVSFNASVNQIIFTVSDNGSPLPVELTLFTGNVVDDTVELIWQTATEVNNYGFEVERSIVEDVWEKVGFVKGNGTTNSVKDYSYIDSNLPETEEVSYRLKQIDNDGESSYSKTVTVTLGSITSADEEIDYTFNLEQNYPNPFNPTTVISFTLPENGVVSLDVYNIVGQKVYELVNETLAAGLHSVEFDASELTSGIYVYSLNLDGKFTSTKKMMLIK